MNKPNDRLRCTSPPSPMFVQRMFACCLASFVMCATPDVLALEIIREVQPDAEKRVQNQARLQPEVLEQWLFNGQAKFANARDVLQKKLDTKIKVVEEVCQLTLQQKQKLQLAGAGDIHSFMRECAKMRRGFDPTDQNQMNTLWQDIQPLRNRFQSSLFGSHSMFERVQQQTLMKEQFELLRVRKQESLQFVFETSVRQLVSQLDAASPLTVERRDALTALLVEKVPAPLALETPQQRQMAQQYVLYACNDLAETKLKSLFDDESWKMFQQGMQKCRGYTSHFLSIGMIKKQ